MHAERDELLKRVFPQLRRMCEQRGITFTDVDLRWGVTDEQTAEGLALTVCLEEIDKCRPFFIGLLGERYGWVPDRIPPGLLSRQPWLAEQPDRSIAELEMVHAALRHPSVATRSRFYFRDPGYIGSLPEGERAEFTESDPRNAERLRELKNRIRESGVALREGYPDPATLGEWILTDLSAAINEDFPAGEELSALDREAAAHDTFARAGARVYIGRQAYYERLDAHVAGREPPLAVLGESGIGKSALLGNWALQYRRTHRRDIVLMHFIGASSSSTDWTHTLRRVMSELKRTLGIDADVPERPKDIAPAFANWLNMASARMASSEGSPDRGGRIVLVLDALNQLEDRDGAPDLVWLPPVLPDNVRIILSTLPGRPLEEVRRREWPTFTLEPLSLAERREFASRYLAEYGKSLGKAQLERITTAAMSGNPLYLRAVLEELRLFGQHEHLDDCLEDYLSADVLDVLFERILTRYENDYERGRPGLVRDAMSCLWAARHGLSEAEILDVLGDDGAPLPHAYWAPLHLAAERSLLTYSGLVRFAHPYMEQAIRRKYLNEPEDRLAAHARLADYFRRQALSARKVQELPWQLLQTRDWQRLAEVLAYPEFLAIAARIDLPAVKRYWSQVESHSDVRMTDAY